MNSDPNQELRQQLEVRIVALLLGEASPFETAELQELLQKDPELSAFHEEMRRTIDLTKEASKQFAAETPPAVAAPKLSPERRKALLARFKEGKAKETTDLGIPILRPEPRRRTWLVPVSAAAGIVLLAGGILFLNHEFGAQFAISELRPQRVTEIRGLPATEPAAPSVADSARYARRQVESAGDVKQIQLGVPIAPALAPPATPAGTPPQAITGVVSPPAPSTPLALVLPAAAPAPVTQPAQSAAPKIYLPKSGTEPELALRDQLAAGRDSGLKPLEEGEAARQLESRAGEAVYSINVVGHSAKAAAPTISAGRTIPAGGESQGGPVAGTTVTTVSGRSSSELAAVSARRRGGSMLGPWIMPPPDKQEKGTSKAIEEPGPETLGLAEGKSLFDAPTTGGADSRGYARLTTGEAEKKIAEKAGKQPAQSDWWELTNLGTGSVDLAGLNFADRNGRANGPVGGNYKADQNFALNGNSAWGYMTNGSAFGSYGGAMPARGPGGIGGFGGGGFGSYAAGAQQDQSKYLSANMGMGRAGYRPSGTVAGGAGGGIYAGDVGSPQTARDFYGANDIRLAKRAGTTDEEARGRQSQAAGLQPTSKVGRPADDQSGRGGRVVGLDGNGAVTLWYNGIGQAVVTNSVATVDSGLPTLGEVPLAGSLFRSEIGARSNIISNGVEGEFLGYAFDTSKTFAEQAQSVRGNALGSAITQSKPVPIFQPRGDQEANALAAATVQSFSGRPSTTAPSKAGPDAQKEQASFGLDYTASAKPPSQTSTSRGGSANVISPVAGNIEKVAAPEKAGVVALTTPAITATPPPPTAASEGRSPAQVITVTPPPAAPIVAAKVEPASERFIVGGNFMLSPTQGSRVQSVTVYRLNGDVGGGNIAKADGSVAKSGTEKEAVLLDDKVADSHYLLPQLELKGAVHAQGQLTVNDPASVGGLEQKSAPSRMWDGDVHNKNGNLGLGDGSSQMANEAQLKRQINDAIQAVQNGEGSEKAYRFDVLGDHRSDNRPPQVTLYGITTPRKQKDAVLSGQFSQDGRGIVTTGSNATVRIWDTQTGQRLTESTAHEGPKGAMISEESTHAPVEGSRPQRILSGDRNPLVGSAPTPDPLGWDTTVHSKAVGIPELKQGVDYAALDAEVRKKQAEVDEMKIKLKINDMEGPVYWASATTAEPEVLGKMHASLTQAQSNYVHLDKLYTQLTNLPRVELRRALTTASPDTQLASLLEERSVREKKLADQKNTLSADHPDVKRTQQVIERIDRQLDERSTGILEGLKAQTAAKKAKVEYYNQQIANAKASGTNQAIDRRPYFQAKRELENLELRRDKLAIRLVQEEVDAAIPKSSRIEIVDLAKTPPAQSAGLWERVRGALGGKEESVARIRVDKDVNSVDGLADKSRSTMSFDPYWIQTESEAVQSKPVLNKVIEKLKLNEAWAGKSGASAKLSQEETYQRLKKMLDVRQTKGTSLIEIAAKSDKPEEAARIANEVAVAYRDSRLEVRRQMAQSSVQSLKKRITEQEQKAAQAQQELARLEKAGKSESDAAAKKPSAPPPTPQPEVATRENAFSTFSLNVSDVSFKLAGASLESGVMPEPASIRVEEFLNAFNYHDPAPAPGARLAFAWERARYPFAHNRDILRFAIQTAARGREAQKPLNLVILLDNSGSMERPDRVAILREALKVLAAQLRPQDRISVIAFARTARLWVDGMAGGKPQEFLAKVLDLNPDGGTNLEEAMDLGYATAARHFMPQGVNRVVLLTDGAANLGDVEPEDLKQKVVTNRQKGIALDCFGVGWEGYNDDLLEVLSSNGDGRYGFLNEPGDAAPEFADQLAGALNVAAADVKTQVEFNPQRVASWRQIGYAKHQLTKEQFRDNRVDAAEIAAAEQGNALYVIEVNQQGNGPLGVVRVRYKVPETGQYVEQEWVVPYQPRVPTLEQASPAMRLAVTAAAFGDWLSQSPFAAEITPGVLQGYLSGVPEVFAPDPRPQRLAWMLRQAQALVGK